MQGHVTHIMQSAVIPTHVDRAWSALLNSAFKWWNIVSSVEGDVHLVGSVLTFKFKDGTVSMYRVAEVSTERKTIMLEMVTSTPPPVGVTSLMHTFEMRDVTASNQTYFQWSSDFGAEVTQAALQDSKHKKLEAFRDFAAFMAKP